MENEDKLLRINEIIKETDLENIMGDNQLSYIIEITKCDKSYNIEESIKKYILKNDICNNTPNTNIDYLFNFQLEEIAYWIDDLSYIIHNISDFKNDVIIKINELYNILESNVKKAYTIVNTKERRVGSLIHNEYLYSRDGVTGIIRYYITEKSDYIVTIVGYA